LAVAESAATFALPVATGALLAMAFSRDRAALCAWIALVPLAIAMRWSRYRLEWCGGLFLGGLVTYLLALDWLRKAQSLGEPLGPRALEWMCLGLLGGLIWLITLAWVRPIVRASRLPLAVLLPAIWVSHEYLTRAGCMLLDGFGFPWLQIGSTQVATPLVMQVADFGGVWAPSAVIACVNGQFADLLLALAGTSSALRRAGWGVATASAMLLSTIGYGTWRLRQPSTPGPLVCLMPGGNATSDSLRTLRAAEHADILLWAELAHQELDVSPGSDAAARLERNARALNKTLFVACDRNMGSHRFRSTVVVTPRGVQGVYDKQRLVPWSEFTPWLRIPGVTREGSNFRPGDDWPVFWVPCKQRCWRASALICYDLCFPAVCRGFFGRDAAPDFFLVSSCEASDSTMSIQRQMFRAACLRAIETRRAVVRNVDHGFSGLIDSCGRLRSRPNELVIREPVVCGPVPIDRRRSLYVALGDWLPILFFACAIALGFLRVRSAWCNK
jgi:apolipoprotein N-acyltransferase